MAEDTGTSQVRAVPSGRAYRGRVGGWTAPVHIPADLDELRGPTKGRVRLPIHVYSSGGGPDDVFDLDTDPGTDARYSIVMEHSTTTDVASLLDLAILRRRWPVIWLSPHVRAAWMPHLGHVPGAPHADAAATA